MNNGGGANGQSAPVGQPQPPTGPQPGGEGGWGGTPAYLPPVTSSGPDWAAMAAENERDHRRRKLMKIGGGALGVVVVGALVATALALSGPDHGTDTAKGTATASANPDGPAPAGTDPSAGASAPVSADPSASAADSASPGAGATVTVTAKPAPGGTKPGGSAGGTGGGTGGSGGAAAGGGLPGLTLANGAAVGTMDGHNGPTLNTRAANGDGFGQASGALVDTSKSFTVSAMVRNNAPTGGRAIISQGSGDYYSFYLGRDYWTNHNQWVFKIQSAPGADDNNVRQAFSTANATTGQWLLLTGVYDADAKKISLYVNGVLQQTGGVPGIWQTSGPTQIGRTKYKGTWTDYWDGSIADLQIWNQALPAAAVGRLNSSGGAAAGVPAAYSWLLP